MTPEELMTDLDELQASGEIAFEMGTKSFCIEVRMADKEIDELVVTLNQCMSGIERNVVSKIDQCYFALQRASYPTFSAAIEAESSDESEAGAESHSQSFFYF